MIVTAPDDSTVWALFLDTELFTVSACTELCTVAGDGVDAAAMLLSIVGGVDDVIVGHLVGLDREGLYG